MHSAMAADRDIARAMAAVSAELCGEPNASLSTKKERRYGSNGSLSVNLETGRWYSHEDGEGGGVIALVERQLGCSQASALAWLAERGHIDPIEHREATEAKSNGRHAKSPGRLVKSYDYRGAEGDLRFRVCRYEKDDGKKTFRQERWDGERFVKGLGNTEIVIYRLDELEAETTSQVLVVEGEKDADNLWNRGFVATCNPMGAGKWKAEYATFLEGRDVVVLPDNDEPGRKHAADVLKSLKDTASRLRILELPDLPEKGDVSDWLVKHPDGDLAGEIDRAPTLDDRGLRLLSEGKTARKVPCNIPALDWLRVANEPAPEQRWIVKDWCPVGSSGVFAGAGSAGKSFLEMVKCICIAMGIPFLGYEVEQRPTLGYFGEDDMGEIWRRSAKICQALDVNPTDLLGRCEFVTTKGMAGCTMFVADEYAVKPTDWYEQVVERILKNGIGYVTIDHFNKYFAIDSQANVHQPFSLFSYLDNLAAEMRGSVTTLIHPSKSNRALGGSPVDPLAQVGGVASLAWAPRYVHALSWQEVKEEPVRVLSSAKGNYRDPFAIKLKMGDRGIVEPDGSFETNAGKVSRPSTADRVLLILRERFVQTHHPIALDELVQACIDEDLYGRCEPGSSAWRDKRRMIKDHLKRHQERKLVQPREDDRWAPNPW